MKRMLLLVLVPTLLAAQNVKVEYDRFSDVTAVHTDKHKVKQGGRWVKPSNSFELVFAVECPGKAETCSGSLPVKMAIHSLGRGWLHVGATTVDVVRILVDGEKIAPKSPIHVGPQRSVTVVSFDPQEFKRIASARTVEVRVESSADEDSWEFSLSPANLSDARALVQSLKP